MIDTAACPLPPLPPQRWFRHLHLTEDAYRAKGEWLAPRLHLVAQIGQGTMDVDREHATTVALREIATDELATWMATWSIAARIVANLPALPASHRWTLNYVPPTVVRLPPLIRDQMLALVSALLTALSRGDAPEPVRDHGFSAVLFLFAVLLDLAKVTAAHPIHAEVPSVVAVPDAEDTPGT